MVTIWFPFGLRVVSIVSEGGDRVIVAAEVVVVVVVVVGLCSDLGAGIDGKSGANYGYKLEIASLTLCPRGVQLRFVQFGNKVCN